MLTPVLILATATLVLSLLALPRIANAPLWRATLTPLASIIGSGFLIVGPILDHAFGGWAPLAMAALCLAAWGFGAAIRENILAGQGGGPAVAVAERLSSWALAAAYMVSVAYYLNLFGAFSIALAAGADAASARYVTSAALIVILIAGWTRGLGALERIEQIAVSVKLAIIAGLLVGMMLYFGDRAAAEALVFNPVSVAPWQGLTLLFGLIVTVQGFETSRYLGARYDADLRARSMRLAQAVSAAIYLAYILLMAFVFPPEALALSETAIIDLMAIVAPVLPVLLIVAALSAQVSAAVADTAGGGGLMEELSRGKLPLRGAYAVLTAAGLLLTWTADVFEIVSYASRAFALYYCLQSAVAALHARRAGKPTRAAGYAALALLGVTMAALGAPVEG